MKTEEFKVTHIYDGQDDLVPFFKAGEEVMYVGEPEGFSPEFNEENGRYVNATGHYQIVLKSCMEAI